jgi:hypothetical protein
MKAQPQQTEQAPTLPERLAAAHANKERFSRIAADPQLSPQAASWARNLARSWGAAVKLGQKALAYHRYYGANATSTLLPRSPNSEQTRKYS